MMEVYALVGPSGTGKSHQAMSVAFENGIDTLIDDGLLIRDGQRLAGSSAKGEKTTIGAVKRAVFVHEEHRAEVKKAIMEAETEKLMILGTSIKMTDRISDALAIPRPCRYFFIDEVSTPGEIATAMELRETYGMHVIPVPVVEVKEALQGYLMRPIRYLMQIKSGNKQGEKTIIQPKFSTIGKLVITNQALNQMVTFLSSGIRGVAQVTKVHVHVKKGNATVGMELSVRITESIPRITEDIGRLLQDRILVLCGINVEQVHVTVRNVVP
ncbi:MAG: alkaline shock response membrane anchor protein AmaP [Clostridiales bacterium]|nr:alkaline shock response membrane anchor protein AmaP [Clostridiales bacterium]